MPVLSVRALHHAPLFRIAGALRTLSIVLFSVSAVVTAPMASAQSAADVLQMPKIADDVADIELDGFLTE